MSRRRAVTKRKVLPEPKYADVALAKFINVVMNDGKKSVAEKIVYGALDRIAERGGVEPLEIFKQAVENVRPLVEIKSRRVGGATYQIPIEVRPLRRTALAITGQISAALLDRLAGVLARERGLGPHEITDQTRTLIHELSEFYGVSADTLTARNKERRTECV